MTPDTSVERLDRLEARCAELEQQQREATEALIDMESQIVPLAADWPLQRVLSVSVALLALRRGLGMGARIGGVSGKRGPWVPTVVSNDPDAA